MEKPQLFGRVLRVVFGVAALASLAFIGSIGLLAEVAIAFLGVSFLVGGLIANPGCEITALPNLLFRTRAHCFCPVFTPVDRVERALRTKRRTNNDAR